jgi:uncharacterized membrane protein
VLAFLSSTALWWLYFGQVAGRVLERIRAATPEERAQIGPDISALSHSPAGRDAPAVTCAAAGQSGPMSRNAAITINRPREQVEHLWDSSEYRPEHIQAADARVTFKDAPGNRGTEIHVDLERPGAAGRVGESVRKLFGAAPLTKVKEDLRRFKQHAETGVIPRSDGSPEGERAERKLKQRPAQPLSEAEAQKVGVS